MQRRAMRVKIISDGLETHIVNVETGEELDGVVSVTWHQDGPHHRATADIRLEHVAVELTSDVGAFNESSVGSPWPA